MIDFMNEDSYDVDDALEDGRAFGADDAYEDEAYDADEIGEYSDHTEYETDYEE